MEPDIRKQSLRQITYGLYVLSARSEEAAGAGTVDWLSQASFNPPLIMVAAKADSGIHSVIEKSGAFAVNFLSADQKSMAEDFFRPTEVDGNKINGHEFTAGSTGSPVLDSVYAYVECRVSDKLAVGDLTVFVDEVVDAGHRRDDKPLEMWGTAWFYGG